MSHSLIICIGSNVTFKERHVSDAASHFMKMMSEAKRSPICISDDYTGIGDNYANIVLTGFTEFSLPQMIAESQRYEHLCGRTSDMKAHGIMPIDIDIVAFDDRILKPDQYRRQYFRQAFNSIDKESITTCPALPT